MRNQDQDQTAHAHPDRREEPTAWRPCPYCEDGYLEGDCTCGDDTCCCLEPEPPMCGHCYGKGGWTIPLSEACDDDEI